MNQQSTDASPPNKVSHLILLGTIILIIASYIFIYAGNIRSFHGSVLASGLATNKESSGEVWAMMGLAEAASAAGIALGLGLLAGGVASTICSVRR